MEMMSIIMREQQLARESINNFLFEAEGKLPAFITSPVTFRWANIKNRKSSFNSQIIPFFQNFKSAYAQALKLRKRIRFQGHAFSSLCFKPCENVINDAKTINDNFPLCTGQYYWFGSLLALALCCKSRLQTFVQ